jgi:hypothetical protein
LNAGVIADNVINDIFSFDPTPFVSKEIVSVNGFPILDYLAVNKQFKTFD